MKNDPFKIYRTLRLAWFFSFASIIAAIMLVTHHPNNLGICIAIYVAITLYLFCLDAQLRQTLLCEIWFITIACRSLTRAYTANMSLSINNE